MKKLLSIAFTAALMASMGFAQGTAGTSGQTASSNQSNTSSTTTTPTTTTKKHHRRHHHKKTGTDTGSTGSAASGTSNPK